VASLTALLGEFVYLDTNIVIYVVEGYAPFERTIRALLDAVDNRQIRAATSELTLAEVLVKPKMDGKVDLVKAYHTFLESSAAIEVLPITQNILVQAAELRASSATKLPDAIHIATALSVGCSSLLTNDQELRSNAPPVVYLSQLTLD